MVEPNRLTPDVNNQTSGGESDIDQELENSRNNAPSALEDGSGDFVLAG